MAVTNKGSLCFNPADDSTDPMDWKLGETRVYDHPTYGPQVLVMLYNNSSAAMLAGQVGVQVASAAPWTTTISAADAVSRGKVAGVAQCAVAKSNYYLGLVRGLGLGYNSGSGAFTTEDDLVSSNGGGVETTASEAKTAAGGIGVATTTTTNGAAGVIYVCIR